MASRNRGTGTGGRGSRLRRTAVSALSFLVLLVAGVGWGYLKLTGNIDTFSADGISGDRPPGSSGGQNVLVIGSDTRSGNNKGLGGGTGAVGRSDTVLLLHVYADRKHAVAVSVPRDAMVDIPACRKPDGSWTTPQRHSQFNGAFSVGETVEGNPACTQNTVEQLTGLRVDHTVVIDFAGFSALTSAVDGVPVCLPKDVYQRDLNPKRPTRGSLVFAKGPQTVAGQRALDYVRLRHGIGDGSDIGRIKRQQAFVASLVKKVKSRGMNPTTLLPLANAATDAMTVDPGLGSADKLLSFALSMKNIDLHNTKFITVPWRYEGERVAVVEPDADALWAALKADRPLDAKAKEAASPKASQAAVSGKGVQVAVYNGTTVTGLAAKAADLLRAHDFTVTGTATAQDQTRSETVVEYGPGLREQARTTARLFPGARITESTAAGNGIQVTVGQDYAAAPPAAPDTASTAPASDAPADLADEARSADDDPCSNLSYG
ncbi:LCP family protein [Streptomyces sp. NBC_00890]|uniref:LCP family protein n=1 Tax=Streptomyces sp. NBC_00869 TaxID=2903684 RepID=UPI003247FC36|nr:LCP family protein [Streptomyces sp. NBC_00891]WSY09395.1 LCP family protein [Streptomyces sp. NBC_00890]WSZ11016.1 LCP family protein [Streptomyces sp. NBC_00869]WSZ21479.1 LCP family protein [Streptomyces sp. NBC_00870]